jgi:4-hydroxy-2-oxoheptanedioate aldolase
MNSPANPLKERLLKGEPVFIFAVRGSRTVDIVSLAASVGFDGFYVDFQHSPMDLETAAQMWTTAHHTPVTPLTRVPDLTPSTISRVLDAGALGIIAPDVKSGAEAEQVVQAALVAPRGSRSFVPGVPSPRFRDVPAKSLANAVSDATLVIAMIETADGVAAAPDIVGTSGIDAIFVGMNDLTADYGVPGEYLDDRVKEAVRRVLDACREHGKPGIVAGARPQEALATYLRMGAAPVYFTGSDTLMLMDGARRTIAEARALHDWLGKA